MRTALAAILFALCLAPAASAQLGGVQLPQVPGPVGGAVNGVTERLPDARETVDTTLATPRELVERRRELTRDLIRENRRELEAETNGFAIARSQILALDMNAEAQARAVSLGFQIVRQDSLGAELGAMITLRAPGNMSTVRALQQLRELDPDGAYDFDHIHWESGVVGQVVGAGQPSASATGPRIGLIDSGVEGATAQRAFASPTPAPAPHGTQVARLLAATAPGARIYAADVYGGSPTGGGSSAVARALGWLAAENVPVINISLVGPRNAIVEATIARLTSRGFVIVAAVGNDGPAAVPLFPASYPGVIGVTGVDARERVLIEAGRGEHVDFAALGIVSPRVRGTSFAAPIVSGLIATQLASPSTANADRAVTALRARARDLGARGRDNIYGDGLVSAEPGNIAAR